MFGLEFGPLPTANVDRSPRVRPSVGGWQQSLRSSQGPPSRGVAQGDRNGIAEVYLLQRTVQVLGMGARHAVSSHALRPFEQQAHQVLAQLRQPAAVAAKVEPGKAQDRNQAYDVLIETGNPGPPARLCSRPTQEIAIYLQPGANPAVAAELHQLLAQASQADLADFLSAYLDKPTAYKGLVLRAVQANSNPSPGNRLRPG